MKIHINLLHNENGCYSIHVRKTFLIEIMHVSYIRFYYKKFIYELKRFGSRELKLHIDAVMVIFTVVKLIILGQIK